MARGGRFAVAFSLAAPAAAPAAPQSAPDPAALAGLGLTDDDPRSLLEALDAGFFTEERLDAIAADLVATLDEAVAAMMRPGERMENWAQAGVGRERRGYLGHILFA